MKMNYLPIIDKNFDKYPDLYMFKYFFISNGILFTNNQTK